MDDDFKYHISVELKDVMYWHGCRYWVRPWIPSSMVASFCGRRYQISYIRRDDGCSVLAWMSILGTAMDTIIDGGIFLWMTIPDIIYP